MFEYDIITVGSGLGGAAVAKVMADNGARVLVLERTREFRDRIRGEVLVPWGQAAAKQLGLHEVFCGLEIRCAIGRPSGTARRS